MAVAAAHTTYTSNLAGVRKGALDAVLSNLIPAIQAYAGLTDALSFATAALAAAKANDFKPLAEEVARFVEGRRGERRALANTLMIDELLEAVQDGDAARVQLVLSDSMHKIDVNEAGPSGRNAVQLAVQRGHADIITILAQKGGDVRGRDNDGRTYLWIAIEENQMQCASVLMEHGANPDTPEDEGSGETILHILIKENKPDTVQTMLEGKASANIKSKDGRTALLHACASGATDVITMLVNAGSHPNARDNNLDSALHLLPSASVHGFLVEHGARMALKNKTAKPLGAAAEKGLKGAEGAWKKKAPVSLDSSECKVGDSSWVANDAYTSCQCCATKFSMMNRRHHCRRCGCLCCGSCSGKKAVQGKAKLRVCDGCYNFLSAKQ